MVQAEPPAEWWRAVGGTGAAADGDVATSSVAPMRCHGDAAPG